MKSRRLFNRRSATELLFGLIRGLKPTATIVRSLRDLKACRGSVHSLETVRNLQAHYLALVLLGRAAIHFSTASASRGRVRWSDAVLLSVWRGAFH